MKRYIEHVKTRPTHERRQHAMQIAGVLTALVFMGWVTTLGVRLAGNNSVADNPNNPSASQAATVLGATEAAPANELEVATTSGYGINGY